MRNCFLRCYRESKNFEDIMDIIIHFLDMFPDYEARGRIFKEIVNNLK